ncbi:MAG: nucleotide pyrophosphohydrolase [Litorilinea sp.]
MTHKAKPGAVDGGEPGCEPILGGDAHTTLSELRTRLHAFTAARDWGQFHTPRSLAISIAIEAAELLEHYQWDGHDGARRVRDEGQVSAEVAAELADVMIYCLHFANATGLDVSDAIRAKLERNESRFPAAQIQGKLTLDASEEESDA